MHNRKNSFYLLLGKRISDLRKEINKNQEALGAFLNLSRSTIVNIEKGRHQVNAYQLSEISLFFNVSIENLIPNENDYNNLSDKVITISENLEMLYSESTLDELKNFIKHI